ncbi:adenylate/guanylate cyclase domain-containing protein [Paenibacillus sp. TAB 01]|uniref:adenylate/guanylate cyclase domain-containing protein n=1 Tax=Paenibacillus sp. TAB 01 TaxID=3368988 RepID=UPI00374FEBF0
MKKPVALLLLVVLLASAAGFYAAQQKEFITKNPFERERSFQSLSRVIADSQNDLYMIDNTKKTIRKLAPDGTIQYSIQSGEDGVYRFNDVTSDEEGNLYVIRALMDTYDIEVKTEQLVRYTSDGKFDKVLFEQSYNDPAKKRYRVGGLKSPEASGGQVSFFVDDLGKVTLYRIGAGASEPKPVYSIQLPANKVLSEIEGTEPGRIFYTTRSGEMYKAGPEGGSTLIYPLPGVDRTRRNFPESLRLDTQGRLLFVDYNSLSINRLDPGQPYIIEELVTQAKAAQQGVELTFFKDDLSLTASGELLIAEDGQIVRRLPDGSFGTAITSGRYSSAYQGHLWFVWAVAAVGGLLVLYALKLLYFNLMGRRLPLVLKQIVVFVPIIAGSMVLLSTVIYNNFVDKMDGETFQELKLLASNGASLIDGDLLERIQSPEEYEGKTYNQFRSKIDSVFYRPGSIENQGFYKAVYKVENGDIYRIMEDDDEMHMFNPFPKSPENTLVITKGSIESGEWSDDTGEWKYGIAPIYNGSGKIVGVFEASKNMEGIMAHRRTVMQKVIQNIILFTTGIVLVFVLMTYVLLSSIRKLRNSVGEIAKGRWDTVVQINTRDEVSELGDSFNAMAAHIREYIARLERFNQAYYRFVPQQFLRLLHKETILDVRLGDQVEENMSTLVCNIRGFYLLSKRLTPEQNFNFVNSFLKRFGPFVRKHQGMVNKYMGPGFMALFPGEGDDALNACIDIRKELDKYNQHRIQSGYSPVDLGIGLHKGPLRLGIIGEEQRLENNIISDHVNLATLLEKLTGPLGSSILITDSVVKSLSGTVPFQYRNLGLIRAEGLEEPLHLYDVYQGDPDTIRTLKERTKARFEEAVMLYQVGRFYDAREAFLMVIKQNRQDRAAQLYFYVCDEYFQSGTTKDWNGTLSVS